MNDELPITASARLLHLVREAGKGIGGHHP